MIKKMFLLVLLIMIVNFTYGEKLGTLTDVINPYMLKVDNGNLYVIEGPVIYIYDLKNFKLKNKFGKKGDGPEEFRVVPTTNGGNVNIGIYSKFVLVNSIGKVSYFTKDGKFIKEIRTLGNYRAYKPLGNKFVGFGGYSRKKNIQSIYLSIYDSFQEKGVPFFNQQVFYNQGDVKPFYMYGPNFFTYDNKIYVEKNKDKILVYDQNGKKISSININQGYKKQLVRKKDEKRYLNYFKNNPAFKNIYMNIKRDIKYSKYFPGIRLFYIFDQKIYIIRWSDSKEETGIAVFDLKGKLLKETKVSFKMKSAMSSYAFTISNDVLYQLIENEDDETKWDLYATEIK